MSQGQFSEHWLARLLVVACLAVLLTIPAQTLHRLANRLETVQLYGYAPDGQVSWTYRAAGGDQTGNNSPVENNLGDAYYYYPDGTFDTAFRNIYVPGGWPQAESPTADSRVDTNSFTYSTGSTLGAYDGYVYDTAGNRTVAVRSWQYDYYPTTDGLNRYNGWNYTESSGTTNGNTTNANLGWTYQYNAENQLIQTNGPGGAIILYYCDAEGRLCARNNNGVTTLFYYAGAQRIEERDANNNLLYSYYYEAPGSDRLLCRLNSSWGLVWYLYDGQGNVTHLCDNSGNVLERYLYDAFGTPTVYDPSGNQRPAGSAYDNRYLFKSAGGYEWQSQAQLYYCRERFYLPYHGRWLQPDPIGQAGGLNIYSYCANDPINNIDPSGLAGTDETGSGVYYSNGDEVPPYTSVNYGDNNQYTGYALPDGTWIDKSAVGNGDTAPQIGSTVTSTWATSAPVQWERPVLGGPQIAQDANRVGAAFAPNQPVGRANAFFQNVGEQAENLVGGAVAPESEAPEVAELAWQTGQAAIGALGTAAKSEVGLDTNALIALLEGFSANSQAVVTVMAGRTPSVSITAAKEFLAGGGDVNGLRSFLQANGGRIGPAASLGTRQALQRLGLKAADSRVVGSAVDQGIGVITRDRHILSKVPWSAEPF
jgi:RHS repeat-associated protein